MLKAFASRMGFAGRLGAALAGTGVAALLFVILMFTHHRSWVEFAAEREIFLQRSSIIRESILDAHLLLEEAIGKSGKDKAQTAFSEIDRAAAATSEMGKHVKPDDVEFSALIKDIGAKLNALKQSAARRFSLVGKDGYSEAEDRFHDDFVKVMKSAEKAGAAIQSRAEASIGHMESRFRLKLAVWLIIVTGGLAALIILARKRERAEEALRRSEESLTRAQSITHVGSWDWNIVTNDLVCSDEIYRILGFQPQEFRATYDTFLAHVHPEDLDIVTKATDTAIKEKNPNSIEHHSNEHRIVRQDGSVRIIHKCGETFYGSDGAPVRMIGTMQDVTERKEAENQLALAAQVFENALEGVVITDLKGTIQFANPAVFTITGYSPEEVIGQNPRILRSDRHPKEFYDNMWKTITTEGGWQGIIWNRRKDGEAFPEWLSITAVKDSAGRTYRYVSVFYDMTRIKQSEDTLKRQSYEDALTKLPNRLLFEDRFNNAIGSAARVGGKVGVALIGLDRLKNINETLGFPAGDQLIQKAAERLRPLVKDGDTLARFGGDEFICVLHDLKDEQDMVKMMLTMLEALSLPFSIDGQELFVTASAGAAFYPSDGADSSTLAQNALVAMRRAKNQDRNSYQLYTPTMNTRSYERLALENDLRKAVGREEFTVHYQPKLSILTGALTGMEALVRWNHPVHGMVSPVQFIPLAEESGLIAPIGEFVLAEALAQIKKWCAVDCGDLSVAVNLSAAQFRDKGLLKTIRDALDRAGVDPSRLDVEVTESMVMGDVNATIATLNGLRDMGVRISMDDFGTGFSSLSYLKRFPIHCLKVDRSFIRDIPGNEDDVAITSAIISMAHSLNLKVVAEGVETVEQLEFLRTNACDEMQGYFFSPPVPAMEMTKILGSGRTLYATK
jgi:diguanylate cyclase (GGDEF)-like protein/PAS domain S-box-containing protein